MAPDTASHAGMIVVQPDSSEDLAAGERWRQWQVRGDVASRAGARRAGIAFSLLFAGLAAWLGLILLNPARW